MSLTIPQQNKINRILSRDIKDSGVEAADSYCVLYELYGKRDDDGSKYIPSDSVARALIDQLDLIFFNTNSEIEPYTVTLPSALFAPVVKDLTKKIGRTKDRERIEHLGKLCESLREVAEFVAE